jgi:hypothetical protein
LTGSRGAVYRERMVRTCGFLAFTVSLALSFSAHAEDAATAGGLSFPGPAPEPQGADGPVVHGNSGGPAVVTVESSGKPVTVSQIVSRMSATGVGAGGTVTVIGVTYKDLCVTPCTFEIKPGLYEFGVHGSGVSGTTNQFDLRSGPQKLRADPGSSGVAIGGYLLTILGGVALTTGVIFLFVSDEIMDFPALPLTLIGAGTTGVGIGMMFAGSTSLDKVGRGTGSSLVARQPVGISLRGRF